MLAGAVVLNVTDGGAVSTVMVPLAVNTLLAPSLNRTYTVLSSSPADSVHALATAKFSHALQVALSLLKHICVTPEEAVSASVTTWSAAFVYRSPLLMVTAPVIYSMAIPLALVDLWASLYQAVCFPVYRIPRVRRAPYMVIDRQHLQYLNPIEALNCVFCGYGNGVIAYVREIASRTEAYWCPIKHAVRVLDPHQRYYQFLEFGDADGYRKRLEAFREALRAEEARPPVANG